MLELTLLGVPKLSWQGEPLDRPSPKVFAVLCYLALQDREVARKDLLELFWREGKLSNLRYVLFKLREVEGSESWLKTDDHFVAVSAATDVEAFEDAVRRGQHVAALEIWHAYEDRRLLDGLELDDARPFTDWLELERSRLENLYIETLQKAIEELERARHLEQAVELARLLLDRDPINETAHRAVMRLEWRRGNLEAALAQFESCRSTLRDELGVEPLEDTLALLQEIESGGMATGKSAAVFRTAGDMPVRPERFIGRGALLREVRDHLDQGRRVLLHGFGGAGKTALAAQLAERHLREQGGKALWLTVGSDRLEALYDALARAFGAQHLMLQAPAADKPEVVRALFRDHQITWCVLDDVWNAYALSKLAEAIPRDVALLVTSRQRYPKLKRVEVGRLERETSLDLLGYFARTDLREDPHAEPLCDLFGDHAFALRIAGITMREEGLPPAALYHRLTGAPHRLTTPPGFAEEGHESITALLSVSLDALPEEAHEVFMAFGALYSTSGTPELLALCARRDEGETEDALFALQARGLAERETVAGSDAVRYRLHDLAYSFARANHHYQARAALRACKTFLERHQQAFDMLDAEVTNLLGAAEAAEAAGDDRTLVEIMKRLVVGDAYYLARGHGPRSLQLSRKALEASKRQDDPETAHFLAARLGDAHRELTGDYAAALGAFEEALGLARSWGNPHREIVMLTLVATTRAQQGSGDAHELFRRAEELAKHHQDDRALCQVYEHMASFAGRTGDFVRARDLLHQALETLERLAARRVVAEAELARLRFFTLLNLGEAHKCLGEARTALEYRQEALDLACRHDNQIWRAYALQELGETYHALGERDRAQQVFGEAFRLFTDNHVSAHRKALVTFMKGADYVVPAG